MLCKVLILFLVTFKISHTTCQYYHHNDEPAMTTYYDLVKIRARGFLPHERYILPYAIIKQIHAEQLRRARQLQSSSGPSASSGIQVRQHISSSSPSRCAKPQTIPLQIQHLPHMKPTNYGARLERSNHNARLYKLYDDDGEHLLNVNIDADTRNNEGRFPSLWRMSKMNMLSSAAETMDSRKHIQHYWLHL